MNIPNESLDDQSQLQFAEFGTPVEDFKEIAPIFTVSPNLKEQRLRSISKNNPMFLPVELFTSLPEELRQAVLENNSYINGRLRSLGLNVSENEIQLLLAFSLKIKLSVLINKFPNLKDFIDNFTAFSLNSYRVAFASEYLLDLQFEQLNNKYSKQNNTQNAVPTSRIIKQTLNPTTKKSEAKSSWFSVSGIKKAVSKAAAVAVGVGAIFFGLNQKETSQEVIPQVPLESTESISETAQIQSNIQAQTQAILPVEKVVPSEPVPLPMINEPNTDIQNQENFISNPAAQIEIQEDQTDEYQQLVDSLNPIETPIELNLRGAGRFPGQNPAFVVRTFIRNNQEVSAYLPSESIDFRGQTFEVTTYGGNLKRRPESLSDTTRSYRDGKRVISTGDFRYMLDANGILVTYIETVQEVGGEPSWLALTHVSLIPNEAVQLPVQNPTQLQQEASSRTAELLDFNEDDWEIVDFNPTDDSPELADLNDEDFEDITLNDSFNEDDEIIQLTDADLVLEDDEFPYDSNFRVV
jgi:hypothetical protein